jgi:hypothetical protein
MPSQAGFNTLRRCLEADCHCERSGTKNISSYFFNRDISRKLESAEREGSIEKGRS